MMKVAEYLEMERPVVSFELHYTRYTAADAALYAVPGDETGFAARLDELLDDPVRREEMGTAGRARLEGGRSWLHSERVLLDADDCAVDVGAARRRSRGRRAR